MALFRLFCLRPLSFLDLRVDILHQFKIILTIFSLNIFLSSSLCFPLLRFQLFPCYNIFHCHAILECCVSFFFSLHDSVLIIITISVLFFFFLFWCIQSVDKPIERYLYFANFVFILFSPHSLAFYIVSISLLKFPIYTYLFFSFFIRSFNIFITINIQLF